MAVASAGLYATLTSFDLLQGLPLPKSERCIKNHNSENTVKPVSESKIKAAMLLSSLVAEMRPVGDFPWLNSML